MSFFFRQITYLLALPLFGIFLVACNSASFNTNIEPSPQILQSTSTLHPTLSPTASPTQSPTYTPTTTHTPTPSITPTVTVIPFPNALPLAKLLLTKDDILSPEFQDWDFVSGLINTFFDEGTTYVKDKSYTMKPSCPIECTKQIWANSQRRIQLDITMVRGNSEQEAYQKAIDLFDILKPYGYEYGVDEYKWINAPTQNSHIGFSNWNRKWILTTSTGTITLMIEYDPSPYSDDGLQQVSIMAAFANLQLYKLKNANLIP